MATDYMRSMLNELMGSSRNDQENEGGDTNSTAHSRSVRQSRCIKNANFSLKMFIPYQSSKSLDWIDQ